jgi:hypothetical protein
MLQQTNLQGMNTTQLQALRLQIALNIFSDEATDNDRAELCKFDDTVKACIPHTFVLVNLFNDVEAMTLEIPDHILESDPSLEWVTCPTCDGEKWLQTDGNGWTSALFSDPRLEYCHHNLNSSFKVCGRCNGVGEVLDLATPSVKPENVLVSPAPVHYPVQLAA